MAEPSRPATTRRLPSAPVQTTTVNAAEPKRIRKTTSAAFAIPRGMATIASKRPTGLDSTVSIGSGDDDSPASGGILAPLIFTRGQHVGESRCDDDARHQQCQRVRDAEATSS